MMPTNLVRTCSLSVLVLTLALFLNADALALEAGMAYNLCKSGSRIKLSQINLKSGEQSSKDYQSLTPHWEEPDRHWAFGRNSWIDTRKNWFCTIVTYRGDFRVMSVDLKTGEIVRISDKIADSYFRAVKFNPFDGLAYAVDAWDFVDPQDQTENVRLVVLDVVKGTINYIPTEIERASEGQRQMGMLDYINGIYYFYDWEDNQVGLDIYTGAVVSKVKPAVYMGSPDLDPESGTFVGTSDTSIGIQTSGGGQRLVQYDPIRNDFKVLSDFMPSTFNFFPIYCVDPHTKRFPWGSILYDVEGNQVYELKRGCCCGSTIFENYVSLVNAPALVKVSGKVVADIDANCQIDPEEHPLSVHPVRNIPGNRLFYPNMQGQFFIYAEAGTMELEPVSGGLWYNNCASNYKVLNVDSSAITDVNFLLEPNSQIEKIEVSLLGSRPVVGRTIRYTIDFRNVGTLPFSGSIKLEYDSRLLDFHALPASDFNSESTAIWDLNDFPVGARSRINVTLRVPPKEILRGQRLCAEVFLAHKRGADELNKSAHDRECQEISGPYDPNDISVSPAGIGELGELAYEEDLTLQYSIRFQNVGNAPAYDVVIRDTLGPEFDLTTVQFGAASHDYAVSVLDGHTPDGKVLEFRFEDIMLPGKEENEPESHGNLKFSVKLSKGLEPGTTITNRAGIFFDFNKPIITNTAVNTITASVTDVAASTPKDSFRLHSHSQSLFEFENLHKHPARLRVVSMLGAEIKHLAVQAASRAQIDMRDQAAGQYLLVVESGHQTFTRTLPVFR